MPSNQQQPNNDDSFDFDFDENDVLVKDGEQEIKKSRNQEIKKSRNQEIKADISLDKTPIIGKAVDLSKQPAPAKDASLIKQQLGTPLDLKKVQVPLEEAEDIQEDLIKQASMQKDKMEALKREGEGLVYSEKDEEEIEKFKKNPLAKSGFNIDSLVGQLMGRLNIVSSLKIDLINRLKNIISSFLRDVRTSRATEELLQRSVESGGLNLSPEHSEQIMEFIKDEYKRIHSSAFIVEENKNKSDRVESVKLIESPKEEVEAVSKKTAREAQVGIFSDEIADSYKKINVVKKQRMDAGEKKDLEQWEKDLAIPGNLRTPEISAPKSVKKLAAGTNITEPALSKPKNTEETKKGDTVLKDLRRKEVLESLNKELAQSESKVKNLAKKKVSWFSKMFKHKQDKSVKSKVHKVESPKSIKQKNNKIRNQETKKSIKQDDMDSSVNREKIRNKEILNLEKKEIPRQQPVVQRVVRDKKDFGNRPKMEDVKVIHPHLVGPIEELSEMTLVDFRRLGSTTQDSIDKVREKIQLSAEEFFNQKIAAINAWRKSEPNQLYIKLGRESISKKVTVEDLINQYILENKPTLNKEEFDLISMLNKELRY